MSARARAACDCGWEQIYRSVAMADYARSRHSCDRWRALQARAARVEARRTDDGPRRPCTHPLARHEHGTRNAYVLDRCRCRRCRDANAAYERQHAKDKAYGRPHRYVDAQPVRDHLAALAAAGMGWQRAARAAGITSGGVMTKLLFGVDGKPPSRRVTRATADALLAVRLDVADGARVDATGTVRRLRALIAAGWTGTALAGRLGVEVTNFGGMLDRDLVRASTAAAVRDLYRLLASLDPVEHGVTRQGASRARNRAAAAGWDAPDAWDDDQLDDPAAEPWREPEVDVDERRAQLAAEVEHLTAAGEHRTRIAARLGYRDPNTLRSVLLRVGRADLWQALLAADRRREDAA